MRVTKKIYCKVYTSLSEQELRTEKKIFWSRDVEKQSHRQLQAKYHFNDRCRIKAVSSSSPATGLNFSKKITHVVPLQQCMTTALQYMIITSAKKPTEMKRIP